MFVTILTTKGNFAWRGDEDRLVWLHAQDLNAQEYNQSALGRCVQLAVLRKLPPPPS